MDDVAVAIAVVGAGAAVVQRLFGAPLERIDKGAGDFATAADIQAEEAMRGLLRRERPDDAVLGEELGRDGEASRRWLLDPLCGTVNYAAGMRIVAVNAALTGGGRVLSAAVAEPFGGEIFFIADGSAYVRISGRDTPLAPSASSRLVDLNLDPPFPNAPAFRAVTLAADEEFVASFRPRVVSSSLALAWVATGQRAAYVTDGDVRDSVHFAAGVAICAAAGCTVSDLQGRPLGNGANGLIVAADPETHSALVRLAVKQRGRSR